MGTDAQKAFYPSFRTVWTYIKNNMASVKDLIYFDFEKVKSISSQLSGGIINEITKAFEDQTNVDGNVGVNVQVFKAGTGLKTSEKNIHTEKVELFHEILNKLEEDLKNKKLISDLNSLFHNGTKSFDDFVQDIPNYSFIKTNGWAKFEDFDKLKLISSNINDIQRFIFHNDIENNPELNKLREQINDKKIEIRKNKTANHKDFLFLSNLEKRLDDLVTQNLKVKLFDENWIERMKIFLDTFSPNRLNLRIMPFDLFHDFQVLATLNEKFLTIGDYNRLIYTYGSRPNMKLTILGILTSCPQRDDIRVHPDDEFNFIEEEDLNESQSFEKVFRNMFSTFEGLDKFFFIPTYPKIGIYPLAIYREIIY